MDFQSAHFYCTLTSLTQPMQYNIVKKDVVLCKFNFHSFKLLVGFWPAGLP